MNFGLSCHGLKKIKLTSYCKSKGKRKRPRYIVPLLKRRPRQKQVPSRSFGMTAFAVRRSEDWEDWPKGGEERDSHTCTLNSC